MDFNDPERCKRQRTGPEGPPLKVLRDLGQPPARSARTLAGAQETRPRPASRSWCCSLVRPATSVAAGASRGPRFGSMILLGVPEEALPLAGAGMVAIQAELVRRVPEPR